MVKSTDTGITQTHVQVPAISLTICVTLVNSLNLSELQFSPLKNEVSNSYLTAVSTK